MDAICWVFLLVTRRRQSAGIESYLRPPQHMYFVHLVNFPKDNTFLVFRTFWNVLEHATAFRFGCNFDRFGSMDVPRDI